jgi:dipeptidyl aminopeptidase/acylaminoacyl peptidase
MLCHAAGALHAQTLRPVDYADLWRPVTIGETALSPDGRQLLFAATPGSFPEPSRNSQIHLTAVDGTLNLQLTHEAGADHQDPRWHPSGNYFGFTSTRGGKGRQLHFMSVGRGESRRVTDAAGGIIDWGWSHDGETLAYLAGEGAARQVWIMDGAGEGSARQLTNHPTPIDNFRWRKKAREILFVAPDAWDEADHRRRKAGFEARPIQRGLVFPDFLTLHPRHLWRVAAPGGQPSRVTEGPLLVHGLEESPTGERIVLVAGPVDPYADSRPNEIYLVNPAGGRLERLTDNDVAESIVGFSPDGALLAVTAPRAFRGRTDDIFVRPVAGGDWRALTESFDNDIADPVWSEDGTKLYFVGADGVNLQLFESAARDGAVRKLTDVTGVISIAESGAGGRVVIGFTDPLSPRDLHAVNWATVGDRAQWTRLTRANPWVDSVRLARTETVRWTSTDGTSVEGLFVYPLDYDPARRYPVITEMHGGPASAFQNQYLPTTPHRAYGHLLAARGYGLFLPNYRGSSNYGEDFQAQISGDYWPRATEDILTGIDHLIARGIAHPDSLGAMGWSAGGHWSNWLLVQSQRFKAIASGAGVANWISMYGQTDNQSSREHYLGKDPALDAPNKPWDDFDHWWAESPLKYIRNASTPTLFHYGERDQRVPMPQGQELHMALKSLGVPTQFLVYPGELHALRQPRNQLVKLLADLGWFETHIRGRGVWLDWANVLEVSEQIEAALDPRRTNVATDRNEGGR